MPARLSWAYPAGSTQVKIYRNIEETDIIDPSNLVATVNSPTTQHDDLEPEITLAGTYYSVVPQGGFSPARTKAERLSLPANLLSDLSSVSNDVAKLALAQAALRGFYLDFANNIYWRRGTRTTSLTSVSGISFTRASVGYADTAAGGLTYFANDIVRRTNLGVFLEPASTNLVPNSIGFTTANSSNIASTTITAPNGVDEATRFDSLQTLFGEKILGSVATVASNTLYNSAIYVRGAPGTKFTFFARNDNGLTAQTGGVRITFTGSWQRIRNMSMTTAVDNTEMLVIGSRVDVDDDATYVEVWGSQIEQAAASTSHIATTAAPVARAADNMIFSNPTTAYPLAVYGRAQRGSGVATEKTILSLDSGAGSNEAVLGFDTTHRGNIYSEALDAAVGLSEVTGALAIDTMHRIAGRIQLNSVRSAAGATLGNHDTTAALPNAATRLLIGQRHSGAAPLNGIISQLAVIPGPNGIADSMLQALTGNW